MGTRTKLRKLALTTTLLAGAANFAPAQEPSRAALERLEWGDERALALTQPLRARAEALSEEEATRLHARLKADPHDLTTRMVLVFHELPELRRRRGERNDPRPHGRLVLGLIEQHPRSNLAGGAGFLLYPYKRDGMYTGPAWEGAIELWEQLVAEHPRDPAIACNAGSFLMADPFRMEQDGPRALELLRRARELAPTEPRWALKLGSFYSLKQRMTRDPEARAAEARAGLVHLRAAWDLSSASVRAALDVMGEPLAMALANAYFDAGEPESARAFALRALAGEDQENPRGTLVFEMHIVLGRIAHGAGDLESAGKHLLDAGKTTGSPTLGSFGPDMTLAKDLLASGRRATVLAFLELCKEFWHSGKDELAAWIAAIEKGGNPWE